MADLFGIDIAGLVADAITGAGGLNAGMLLRGTDTYTFQGFVAVKEVRVPDTLVAEARPVLTIIGGTLTPAVEPAVNDQATIGSITYDLVRLLRRDPASAVYEFEVR